ncbi:MAG: transglutaminase domain-containing protein [Planctomycetes bacterium]|nr:transglutaminase domain-containing protein [Planctomycetota bacterium]
MSSGVMTRDGRPGGVLAPLAAWHLAFLAFDAFYLVVHYPASTAAVAVILCTAAITELLPSRARRFLIEELLLVAGAAASFLICVDIPLDGPAKSDSFAGWARMVFAYWLLIPARPGLLRWQLSLTIAELLILGRKPGGGAGEAMWLVPIGLGCLAVDAWLRATLGSRTRGGGHRGWGFARWTLAPIIAVLVVTLVGGVQLVRHAPRASLMGGTTSQRNLAGIDNQMRIGNHSWVEKDPHVIARLMADEDRPLPVGPQYLRYLALPRIELDGSQVGWNPGTTATRPIPRATISPRSAWVVKNPEAHDMVLVPDGGAGAVLDEQRVDRFGNRYRFGLGEQIRAYKVDLGEPTPADEDAEPKEFLDVPKDLRWDSQWATIEDESWRDLPPREAAMRVAAFLQSHCVYATENLPTPANRPGGSLHTFLFGSESERRGHCQYFASAAVVLLRRAGHPARCVAGLASPERDDAGYTFRAFHAHAWVEVLDDDGVWRRIDPTPASHYEDLPTEDADGNPLPAPDALPDSLDALARETNAPTGRWRWIAVAIAVAAMLAVAVRTLMPSRLARPTDPKLKALARHTGDLVRFAESIGVRVAPHWTLTAVAQAVQARTGVALDRHLAVHLAARYGGGPLPEPWPIATLRAAMARREPAASKR